ncbi:MAG TPA: bacillithiol biosynthesis deacetylase BshB1 [Puia sp.]|jgi:bacillithiol biosynthesis deacetylase BshB1|nr:bacillithiol biosynthesis deacetylase BshB1 [Puia sp.]
MKKIQVLAIAVHPDDVELCCSGTLMMEKLQGKTIGVIDLTRGELGTRGTAEIRQQESDAASVIMNLDIRENLGMPDGFFRNDEVNQRKIIRALRKYQPEIVLSSALEDRHPDHGRAGHLISDSCFLSGLRKISTQDEKGLEQEHWRPKYVFHFIQDRFYEPDFVYDISPVFERKLESIRAYQSQFHSATYDRDEPQTYISSPEFLDSVIGRAQMCGKMIGVKYAEGFISKKMIGIDRLDSFIQFDT